MATEERDTIWGGGIKRGRKVVIYLSLSLISFRINYLNNISTSKKINFYI